MFVHVNDTTGKTAIQYLPIGKTAKDAEVLPQVSHPKSVMVWLAICSKGVIGPYFVVPGVKINAKYYQKKILARMVKDIDKIKKEHADWNYVYHQDSAPAHTAKTTLAWLRKNKVKYIRPDQWLPNSPDAAPLDYLIWHWIKQQLNKHTISTIRGLKTAISGICKNIPQSLILRALKAWPKRLRKIYYAKGGHIEHEL